MASLDTKALVFSCLACRAIVADSSDIITGVERPLQFILVAGVTGVREEPEEQHAAGDGAIVGSTYRSIACEQCGAVVGRIYTRTELAVMREAFCLDVSRLRSYELGSGKQRLAADSIVHADGEAQELKPVPSRHHADLSQRLDDLSRAYESLQRDMLNVQHLACLHDERLQKLEAGASLDN